MNKWIVGAMLSGMLIVSATGCITTDGLLRGGGAIETAINDNSIVAGEDQISAVVTEGVKWIDNSVGTMSGGGVGLAGLLYLARLALRYRKKSKILIESMDGGSLARAKELAKHTSVERDIG
jgi:hypothetical protein